MGFKYYSCMHWTRVFFGGGDAETSLYWIQGVFWLGPLVPKVPKVLGSDQNSKTTYQLQMLVARHFDS